MGLTRGFIRGKTLSTTDDLNSKANSLHTHSTGDITSGTLPLTRGGTGVTSISALKTALGISSRSSEAKIYYNGYTKPSDITFDFMPCFFIGELSSSSPSYIGYVMIEYGIRPYEYAIRITINTSGTTSPTLDKN